jgi:hypothetical protein
MGDPVFISANATFEVIMSVIAENDKIVAKDKYRIFFTSELDLSS